MRSRSLIGVKSTAYVVVLAALFTVGGQAQQVDFSTQTYASHKTPIVVERFAMALPGRRPAVILLYGASGLTGGPETLREYARKLARAGYVVFLPHYFDATESLTAGDLPVPRNRFERWYQALEDGISFVGHQPEVDAHRIGLVGLSLGAYLALWDASQDSRVKAVVEYYGSINMFLGPAHRMPPTLILHGSKDTFVSVSEAHRVESVT